MRISFKIIATLSCLPQITILARLLLTRHWQLNTVCFPGLSWLSHPAGGMLRQRGPQHWNSNWPWLYKLINQTVVSLHLIVQWGLYFPREKSKHMACFLFSFYNRKLCSVKNIYIQSCERWLRNHCDPLHNELSWNFDGLLTHQSVQPSWKQGMSDQDRWSGLENILYSFVNLCNTSYYFLSTHYVSSTAKRKLIGSSDLFLVTHIRGR